MTNVNELIIATVENLQHDKVEITATTVQVEIYLVHGEEIAIKEIEKLL